MTTDFNVGDYVNFDGTIYKIERKSPGWYYLENRPKAIRGSKLALTTKPASPKKIPSPKKEAEIVFNVDLKQSPKKQSPKKAEKAEEEELVELDFEFQKQPSPVLRPKSPKSPAKFQISNQELDVNIPSYVDFSSMSLDKKIDLALNQTDLNTIVHTMMASYKQEERNKICEDLRKYTTISYSDEGFAKPHSPKPLKPQSPKKMQASESESEEDLDDLKSKLNVVKNKKVGLKKNASNVDPSKYKQLMEIYENQIADIEMKIDLLTNSFGINSHQSNRRKTSYVRKPLRKRSVFHNMRHKPKKSNKKLRFGTSGIHNGIYSMPTPTYYKGVFPLMSSPEYKIDGDPMYYSTDLPNLDNVVRDYKLQ
jgi:hypothetical protein